MNRETKRHVGGIIHLSLIVLYWIWVVIIGTVVGHEEFMKTYNSLTAIGFGIICSTCMIHGIILALTIKNT
jgi:hypothetical protein